MKRAKDAGYRSRAAFKLVEMDDKARFLKSGQRLVDLGCAPGGWAQVAAERIGLKQGKGRIVGIDLLHIDPIPGVELLQMDFMADDAPARLKELLGGPADGVMSDMAANTTGHKKTDHLRIIGLAEAAVEFAGEVLAPGGFFLCKLFQGGDSAGLLTSSSATSRWCATSSRPPAAPTPASSTCWPPASGAACGRRPEMFDAILSVLDWAGLVVFAITGALVASRKQMDIVGFCLLASVTGVGAARSAT